MNRRQFVQQLTRGAALAGLMSAGRPALGATESGTESKTPTGSQSPLKITKVKAILTAPSRIRLCVVKVETSEPGLYGLGCATFTQRIRTVVTAVDQYLAPFLAGKDPDNIEDLWQAMYQSSYWRNGPVLMNALSGWTRPCGTSRPNVPACPYISCWAANAAWGCPFIDTPAARPSRR